LILLAFIGTAEEAAEKPGFSGDFEE